MPDERDWLVLYDAECGICRALLAVLLSWDRRHRLRPLALQDAEAGALLGDLTDEERMASWHLVAPPGRTQTGSPSMPSLAGRRWSAGRAVPPLLRLLPGGRTPARVFNRFPITTERGYRWVADHRSGLSRLLPARLKRRGDYLRPSPP
jgi:predicted DCC family thiol-disulfide oxidoreductase YuxK